jgi:hypothetical protein
MLSKQPEYPDMTARHLNQPQLADRWHLSQRTLERWRCFGGGPPFLKINGRILYRLEDVEAFETAQVRMPAGRRKRDAAAGSDAAGT